MDSLEI